MYASRLIITAETRQWAMAAATSMTGFATSVIGCKCEAGIEKEIPAEQSPDRRPGVSVLLFAMDAKGVGKRLVERVGQCVMTCPTTACYDGLAGDQSVVVGGQLRYFGDGYQISKKLGDKRHWRIPVMDGEFLVDERFTVQEAVGGGNIILLARDSKSALRAASAATKAMNEVDDVILPFPDGVVRSGSKVGSRYKSLMASTNEKYCPSLRGLDIGTELGGNINCVLEIVIDGLTETAVKTAMQVGMQAAARPGIKRISAGNYGGNLGQYKIQLKSLLEGISQ